MRSLQDHKDIWIYAINMAEPNSHLRDKPGAPGLRPVDPEEMKILIATLPDGSVWASLNECEAQPGLYPWEFQLPGDYGYYTFLAPTPEALRADIEKLDLFMSLKKPAVSPPPPPRKRL